MAQALLTPRPVDFTTLSLTFHSCRMGKRGLQRLDTSARDCNLCPPAQQDPTSPAPTQEERGKDQGKEIIQFILKLRQASARLPLVPAAPLTDPEKMGPLLLH